MGHISLISSGVAQVRNPASLSKNLIITGPNAAGKSTYVKSILTNIILAQSLGISCAYKAQVTPVHALGSFMRISDELGSKSLFEAEVKRCAELIVQAEKTSAEGKLATYFLDEPMHSTPPIEGSATSKAVIEYIGNLPGIRVLVTTHYHDIITMDSSQFRNISMDAIEEGMEGGTKMYSFPYKIQSGASYKSIALELLEKNKLPSTIVERAISIKNNLVLNRSVHNHII
jgi:DNA mismatch repair protein MutS